MELNTINVIKETLLCDTKTQVVLDPREIEYFLLQVFKAIIGNSDDIDLSQVVITPDAQQIADSLKANSNSYVILGDVAKTLPNYAGIMVLAHLIAKATNGRHGVFARYANEVGANVVGFVPQANGMNAQGMLLNHRRCYVLFNTELECDAYDSKLALHALGQADTVVVMSAYINDKMREYADVIIPITPFTETAGSFVNMEGKLQQFNGVTRPLGYARPAWKVLRVIANNLGLKGFDYESIEDVRDELMTAHATCLTKTTHLTDTINSAGTVTTTNTSSPTLPKELYNIINTNPPVINGFVRVGLTGIYNADSIVRRATALQETNMAKTPVLMLSVSLANKFGVRENMQMQVRQHSEHMQDSYARDFVVHVCDLLPDTVIGLAVAPNTIGFAGRFANIEIL